MAELDQRVKQAINQIIRAGYQLDPNAFEFLKTLARQRSLDEFLKTVIKDLAVLPEKPLFLTKKDLEITMAKNENIKSIYKESIESLESSFKPYAKEIQGKIEVLKDPTDGVGFERIIDNYCNYFKDRFTKINKILRERTDVRKAISINEASKMPSKSIVKVIGIVMAKRERKRSIFIQLEDFESSITVLVPSTSDRILFEKAKRLLVDQVVCVEIIKIKEDFFIAKDFISPDIPERNTNKATEQVYVAFTSDIHIGSKKFLSVAFDRFIKWLNGKEGSTYQKEVASRIKYLVIAGDIVEGIGIYPRQERELAINDIYEQYSVASKLLGEVPEYIDIIIIPGNHDATRQALPQPAILKEYAKPLYALKNVTMLGDPARIRLNGVDILLYHGRGLDDIISVVPDVTYLNLRNEITIAMKYLLKTRHLAPIYGSKTPIAPNPVDNLVINTPPSILQVGHVHVMGYECYRGTLLINSGTWQGQTDFQEKMGLIPTPGIVPIVDLKTFKVMPINFLNL